MIQMIVHKMLVFAQCELIIFQWCKNITANCDNTATTANAAAVDDTADDTACANAATDDATANWIATRRDIYNSLWIQHGFFLTKKQLWNEYESSHWELNSLISFHFLLPVYVYLCLYVCLCVLMSFIYTLAHTHYISIKYSKCLFFIWKLEKNTSNLMGNVGYFNGAFFWYHIAATKCCFVIHKVLSQLKRACFIGSIVTETPLTHTHTHGVCMCLLWVENVISRNLTTFFVKVVCFLCSSWFFCVCFHKTFTQFKYFR